MYGNGKAYGTLIFQLGLACGGWAYMQPMFYEWHLCFNFTTQFFVRMRTVQLQITFKYTMFSSEFLDFTLKMLLPLIVWLNSYKSVESCGNLSEISGAVYIVLVTV